MVDQIAGPWITSFSGFVHDQPVDSHDTPRVAAYTAPGHSPSGGYFFAASLMCLNFDGHGAFTGKAQVIRGGRPAPQDVVKGTYELQPNAALGVMEGSIHATYPDSDPTHDIHMTYNFVVRTWDEIDWLRTSSDSNGINPFRHQIAQGTLRRVSVHP